MNAGAGRNSVRVQQYGQFSNARQPGVGLRFDHGSLDESEVSIKLQKIGPEKENLNDCDQANRDPKEAKWERVGHGEDETFDSFLQVVANRMFAH